MNIEIFGLIIALILGLGWGGFATMAVYRLPRGIPWIGDEPRCFECKHTLNIIDYISILSYFLWRGKCRYCGKKYECPFSYLVVETAITIGIVLCYTQYHFSELFVLLMGAVVCFVILAVIDAEHQRIPAKVLLSALMLGVIYRTLQDDSIYGLLYGGIIGGIVAVWLRYMYYRFKGQKEIAGDWAKFKVGDRFSGPGFDYCKLLAIVGVWLPLAHFLMCVVILAAFVGLWYVVHKQSMRLGGMMGIMLLYFVLYPARVDEVFLKFVG